MNRLFVGVADGHGLLPDLLFQSLRILAALDQHLPLGDRLAGLQDQLLARDRFDQVAGRPAPQDVDRRAGFLRGGDHQHHDIGADRENLFQQVGAGSARERDVEGHQLHAVVVQAAAGRRGAAGLEAFEALVGEPAGNERPHVEFVVHDQRSFSPGANCASVQTGSGHVLPSLMSGTSIRFAAEGCTWATWSPRGAATAGKHSVNFVPLPNALSTSRRAAMLADDAIDIGQPQPGPLAGFLRRVERLENPLLGFRRHAAARIDHVEHRARTRVALRSSHRDRTVRVRS